MKSNRGCAGRRVVVSALALAATFSALIWAPTASATVTVTCTAESATMSTPATLLVAVNGETSSTDPVTVAVEPAGPSQADYKVSLGATSVCVGTPAIGTGADPDVTVQSSQTQYLVLDDSNTALDSGCSVQVSTSFSAASDTVAVNAPSGSARTIGATGSSLNLDDASGGCSSPDVTLGANVTTVDINGASAEPDALDLSNATGPLVIDMPTGTSPGTVAGFKSGSLSTIDFSNIDSVIGPTGGYADFVAGLASASFTGQGSNNTLDLSALPASSTSPATINESGGPVVIGSDTFVNDTVVAGSLTDTFSGISTFDGATSGSTNLHAGSSAVTFDETGPDSALYAGNGAATFTDDGSDGTLYAGSGSFTFTATGADETLDLAAIPAYPSAPIGVNDSGLPALFEGNSLPAGTIAVGTSAPTGTFSGVTTFVGSSDGSTVLYGGSSSATVDVSGSGNTAYAGSGSLTFDATGSNSTLHAGSGDFTFTASDGGNTLDLTDVSTSSSSPATITAPTAGATTGTVTAGSASDTFSDVQTFEGSTDGFTTFTAGPGSATFIGGGSSNTVDLSALPATGSSPALANFSGSTVGSVLNDTVVQGSSTTVVSDVSTVLGAKSGNTTMYAGSSSPSFTGQGSSGNELDFSGASAPVQITDDSGVNDSYAIGATTTPFQDVQTFVGPASGDAELRAGSDPFDFEAEGSDNQLDLTAVPSSSSAPTTIDATGTIIFGSTTGLTRDLFADVGTITGPSGGNTTFDAATNSVTFTGQGPANTLDLSALPASSSVRLDINDSGGEVGTQFNDTYALGSTIGTFGGIQAFVGSGDGNTTVYAGAGDLGFTGESGTGNALDLTRLVTSSSSPATIAAPTASAPMGTVTAGSTSDTFAGVQTFNGPTTGNTTYTAGSETATFAGSGPNNTLDLAALPATSSSPVLANFSGTTVNTLPNDAAQQGSNLTSVSDVSKLTAAGNTTMYAGSASPPFDAKGSGNTLDLSRLPAPLAVNISGGPVNAEANDSYLTGAVTNTFTGVQTFIGSSSGDTTLYAGPVQFALDATGSGNRLDLSALTSSATPVTIDASTGTITSGSTTDDFSNVGTFTGPSNGDASFQPGSGDETFTGNGAGNTVDLSSLTAASSLTASMAGPGAGSVTAGGSSLQVMFTGVSTVDGSAAVPTTFVPNASASATPSPQILFVGKDSNSGGSTLDLSGLASPSGLRVSLGANTTSNPGQATATVSGTAVTFATFASINRVIGPPAPTPVFLDPGTVSDGVQLVNIAPAAQTITFTSTPPAAASQGDSYTPTATGGGSGKPVEFSIAPSSTSGVCTIGGEDLITFTGVGTCIIDAYQGASDEYSAAQAQQMVQIAAVPAPPPLPPAVTTSEIVKTLDSVATPPRGTTTQSLLSSGGVTVQYKALEAGTATVSWYQVPAGAHIARAGARPRPILLAKGSVTVSKAGKHKLRIKLTAAGRRLLKHVKRVRLTSRATFKPAGKRAVTTTKKFTLRR